MSQNGRVGGCRIHLPTQIHQEHIYKWISSHRAPTEHYQRTSDTKRARKTWVGWKIEGKKRGSSVETVPLRGAEGEVPAPREAPSPAGRSMGSEGGGALGTQWTAQKRVCGRPDRVRPTQMVCAIAYGPSVRSISTAVGRSWMLEHGVGREDCCWLQRDSLKRWEWGVLQPGMFIEEAQGTIEMKCHCWIAQWLPQPLAPGQASVLLGSLTSRCQWMSHEERWGGNHSWAPGPCS